MTFQTNQRFKNSTMVIEGSTIRWEDHMIQTSNISQVWIGNCLKEQFPVHLVLILFFISLSGISPVKTIVMLLALALCILAWAYCYWNQKNTKDINFEICSGKVYSFVSNNDEFIGQVYDIIRELIVERNINLNFNINFHGDGKIIDNTITETEKTDDKQILNIQSIMSNNPIVMELEKLLIKYYQKKDLNKENIELITQIIQLIDVNDNEGIKKSFSKFIMMGLIKDCNELGLIALINAIRNSVYC